MLAGRWLAVAEAVSRAHAGLLPGRRRPGSDAQRKRFLPDMLGGELLGAYCLSEPQGGSDAASLTTRAVRDGDEYVVTGTKAWITHAGVADFYNVFCRTGGPAPTASRACSPTRPTPGIAPAARGSRPWACARRRWRRSPSTARGSPADRLVGEEGIGFRIAMSALDSGRLGIAACAVGLAQAALDYAVGVRQGARPVRPADHRLPGSRLHAGRHGHPDLAPPARSRCTPPACATPAGRYGIEAAKAKLFATDMAMKVTTDAVQVLGGYGYVTDHPVERYFREAKVLQIVEGTNQIQRMVIARSLSR